MKFFPTGAKLYCDGKNFKFWAENHPQAGF